MTTLTALNSIQSYARPIVNILSAHLRKIPIKNVNFFIQETISHPNLLSVGSGTNLADASLVKTVILATITQYVKTGYSELAMMTTVVIFTHRTV